LLQLCDAIGVALARQHRMDEDDLVALVAVRAELWDRGIDPVSLLGRTESGLLVVTA
jgi:hypothetical protein